MSEEKEAFLTDYESHWYQSLIHTLRSQGWSRIEAEGEALERIERRRQQEGHAA